MRSNLPIGNTSAGPTSSGWFSRLALATAKISGKPATFILAAGTIFVWGIAGPIFHYSDTWQLVTNTGTTIITFLMVFLIQATQNRNTTALQLKLDELIIAAQNARNEIAGIEEAAEHVIETAKTEMKERGRSDVS
jgi:low affinity Fe/Cu permease